MEPLESGRVLLDEPELAEEEELWTDDTDDDHSGWFCALPIRSRVLQPGARSSRST